MIYWIFHFLINHKELFELITYNFSLIPPQKLSFCQGKSQYSDPLLGLVGFPLSLWGNRGINNHKAVFAKPEWSLLMNSQNGYFSKSTEIA